MRRAQQHQPLDVAGTCEGQRRARDESPQAVRHDRHAAAGRAHALGQRAAKLCDRQPPVIVMKLGRQALRAQI